MVTTFELTNGEARQMGLAEGMNAASASLPQGAYTTFRTYSGSSILWLAQHLRRLEESATLLGMRAQLDDAAVRHGLGCVLSNTGFSESRFRLTFAPPHLYISVEPFIPYAPALYEAGVSCASVAVHRQTPHAKSTAFITAAGDSYKALPEGVHEGLMVAEDGAVLEGLSSSFFAVLDNVLYTENERALIGVTQSLVLEIASVALPDLQRSANAVHVQDLSHLAECFITSVSREIMPVVRIDDVIIGNGIPGPYTRRLMMVFSELVQREAQSVFAQ